MIGRPLRAEDDHPAEVGERGLARRIRPGTRGPGEAGFEAQRPQPLPLFGADLRVDALEEPGAAAGGGVFEQQDGRAEAVQDARQLQPLQAVLGRGVGVLHVRGPDQVDQPLLPARRVETPPQERQLAGRELALHPEEARQGAAQLLGPVHEPSLVKGLEVGEAEHLGEAVAIGGSPRPTFLEAGASGIEEPEPVRVVPVPGHGGEEAPVPDAARRGRLVRLPDVLRPSFHRLEPLAEGPAGERAAGTRRPVEDVVAAVAANEPGLLATAGAAGQDVEHPACRQLQRGLDVDADDGVIPAESERGRDAATLDPGAASGDDPSVADLVVDLEAVVVMGRPAVDAHEVVAAGDQLAGGAEVEEAAAGQEVQPERDPRETPEDVLELRAPEGRVGAQGGADVVLPRRFFPEGAADLAVEVEPPGLEGGGQRTAPAQLPAGCRLDVAEPDEPERRLGVEAHHADVEDRLAVTVEGPVLALLRRRRLLEEPSHASGRGRAVDAVVLGHVRAGETAQARDPRPIEPHPGRVEGEQHVAGGDDDLSLAFRTGGEPEVGRQLAVEEGQPQHAVRVAGDGHEDLAAGGVGGQPARIAAGVDDQHAQGPEHVSPGFGRGEPLRPVAELPAEDREQAVDRAPAAAHAPSVRIGDRQDVPHVGDEAQVAPPAQLLAVGRGLGLVRGGDDQVVPAWRGHFGR